ncbi:MAG: hypothetical protein JO303_10325 [Caulobacteraceae bacterium]|nr:hypothetical protein [Caulobacteraceae bacterium]
MHSDQCFVPSAARRHFEASPAENKHLEWDGDTPHLSFYDQPEIIDRTLRKVDAWYRAHL